MGNEDAVSTGVAKSHRQASENLHKKGSNRGFDNMRMLWTVGYGDLIRRDYYSLLALSPDSTGYLLDAGCGTGIEIVNFRRMAPKMSVHGVDISEVTLTQAVESNQDNAVEFCQSSLDCLPYKNESFDYLSMHEVIEHVEDPAVTLRELSRVLKPGAVGVIATPNGSSLFPEHLRQRIARLFGVRGAPVGEDHVRPPSYWRRELRHAGFVIERQMFDASAIELQTYILPASWMMWTSRILEPLRIIPGINLLICDRIKFRVRKPGRFKQASVPPQLCCPVCRDRLNQFEGTMTCVNGHRFKANRMGLMDFTSTASTHDDDGGPALLRGKSRLLRRVFLGGAMVGYIIVVVALLPVGYVIRKFRNPFDGPP
jgi:ubiquinone/menaquinone biosynthesis C-methylase UbiE